VDDITWPLSGQSLSRVCPGGTVVEASYSHFRGVLKSQDWILRDEFTGVVIAGPDIDGQSLCNALIDAALEQKLHCISFTLSVL